MEINNEFVVEHLLDLALENTWHEEDYGKCVEQAVEQYNEELCEDEDESIDFTEELRNVADRNDIIALVEQQVEDNCNDRWEENRSFQHAVAGSLGY